MHAAIQALYNANINFANQELVSLGVRFWNMGLWSCLAACWASPYGLVLLFSCVQSAIEMPMDFTCWSCYRGVVCSCHYIHGTLQPLLTTSACSVRQHVLECTCTNFWDGSPHR
jgi:hypothetical protein